MSTQIPNDVESKKKILNALKEISNSLARMDAERDLIKETLNDIEDEFELSKRYMRKVAYIYHKQNITDFKEENQQVEEVYESLMRG